MSKLYETDGGPALARSLRLPVDEQLLAWLAGGSHGSLPPGDRDQKCGGVMGSPFPQIFYRIKNWCDVSQAPPPL